MSEDLVCRLRKKWANPEVDAGIAALLREAAERIEELEAEIEERAYDRPRDWNT